MSILCDANPGESATRCPRSLAESRTRAAPGILLLICRVWVVLCCGCKSLSFRTARTPIGRRECHAPESGARVIELKAHLGNAQVPLVALDHRAGDLFACQNVTQRQLLSCADRLLQQDECAVGADHFGLRALGKCRAIRLFATHEDSHAKKNALASPLAWSSSRPSAGGAHSPPFPRKWHAWREPNANARTILFHRIGFNFVQASGLYVESSAVPCLLRESL